MVGKYGSKNFTPSEQEDDAQFCAGKVVGGPPSRTMTFGEGRGATRTPFQSAEVPKLIVMVREGGPPTTSFARNASKKIQAKSPEGSLDPFASWRLRVKQTASERAQPSLERTALGPLIEPLTFPFEKNGTNWRGRMLDAVNNLNPSPIADRAYWLFTPIAIALATPPLLRFFASDFDIALAPQVASVLTLYSKPTASIANGILSVETWSWSHLPTQLVHALPQKFLTSIDWFLFSLAGGAFVASWIVASLQRTYGDILGAVAALAIALVLGISFTGLCILAVAMYFVLDAGLAFTWRQERNVAAILVPLVLPFGLVAMLVGINVIFAVYGTHHP